MRRVAARQPGMYHGYERKEGGEGRGWMVKGRDEIANKMRENEPVIFILGTRSALFFAIRAFLSRQTT